MAKRGQKSSKREAEAGKKNLEAWLRGNPSGGNLKHGIYPKISRRRFSDLRTREGKALNAILKGIVKEIGPELDTRQSVILALISAKLIVVLQIQKYLETLPELVNQREGKVPYIIEHTFPRYYAGLIKLLDSLYGDDGIRRRKKGPPSILINR